MGNVIYISCQTLVPDLSERKSYHFMMKFDSFFNARNLIVYGNLSRHSCLITQWKKLLLCD